jgi:hypothetical protein
MGDKRQATLLDFAIAASIAVVPLLLLVLIAVAEVRPGDPSVRARPGNNQHVSLREVAALKTFERAIVRRDAAKGAPTADALLERFPQCRHEWDGRGGRLQRLRQFVARSHEATLSPAQRMAAQLQELDAALKRFQHGRQPARHRRRRLRRDALVRRRPHDARDADRNARLPRPPVRRPVRGHCARRHDDVARRRPDAAGAGVARAPSSTAR